MLCIFLLQNPAQCRISSGASSAIYLQIFYHCRGKGKVDLKKGDKLNGFTFRNFFFNILTATLVSTTHSTHLLEIFEVQPHTDK